MDAPVPPALDGGWPHGRDEGMGSAGDDDADLTDDCARDAGRAGAAGALCVVDGLGDPLDALLVDGPVLLFVDGGTLLAASEPRPAGAVGDLLPRAMRAG